MFAVQSEPGARQSAATLTARQIVIEPTSARYVEQMDRLSHLVYPHDTESRVEEFLSQIKHFPEGQFIALDITDPANPQVVGYTSSMRLQFNPAERLLSTWSHTTGYG